MVECDCRCHNSDTEKSSQLAVDEKKCSFARDKLKWRNGAVQHTRLGKVYACDTIASATPCPTIKANMCTVFVVGLGPAKATDTNVLYLYKIIVCETGGPAPEYLCLLLNRALMTADYHQVAYRGLYVW